MTDFEQLAQESAIWPWIDEDCMSDTCEEDFFDDANLFEDEEDFE